MKSHRRVVTTIGSSWEIGEQLWSNRKDNDNFVPKVTDITSNIDDRDPSVWSVTVWKSNVDGSESPLILIPYHAVAHLFYDRGE